MVTRPGVNRISMALWVTSIQDGCASGRQFAKISVGRAAFSSANMCATFLAAASFHGGGLVLTCASWSVIFGFQTPLQSGSLARSVQSCAVGGGLMTGGSFLGACAQAIEGASSRAMRAAEAIKEADVTCISPRWRLFCEGIEELFHCEGQCRPFEVPAIPVAWRSVHCEAGAAAKRNHRDPYQKRDGRSRFCKDRRAFAGCIPAFDIAHAEDMKCRHVEAGEYQHHELGLKQAIMRIVRCVR